MQAATLSFPFGRFVRALSRATVESDGVLLLLVWVRQRECVVRRACSSNSNTASHTWSGRRTYMLTEQHTIYCVCVCVCVYIQYIQYPCIIVNRNKILCHISLGEQIRSVFCLQSTQNDSKIEKKITKLTWTFEHCNRSYQIRSNFRTNFNECDQPNHSISNFTYSIRVFATAVQSTAIERIRIVRVCMRANVCRLFKTCSTLAYVSCYCEWF